MATGYNNTVPLGQEGTGAAQILGPNRALQYALGKMQRDQDRLYQQQEQYQQRQRAYGDQFQKTLFEMNELANSPMFQGDFAALTNNLVKQGAELRAQGINPYNPNQTPESMQAVQQWTSDMNKIKQAKTLVDNIYAERKSLVNKYNSNPSSYDFDEYTKIKDFEKNFNLQDVVEGRAQLPALSEIYDIGKGLTTKYGEVYTQGSVMDTDPTTGQPIRREVREADKPRIAQIINSEFTSGTPAANEVNRRLRNQFGEGASMSGLLGTTDKDQIRSVLDAEFRNNTSESNPVVELMARGKVPSLGSEEYNRFLDDAVNEQLKAERILDDAKQQAANSLIGKVNTKDTWKFDFSLQREQRQRESHASSQANRSLENLSKRLNIQKTQKELDGLVDMGDVQDVVVRSNTSNATTGNPREVVLRGSKPGSTTSFIYNPSGKSFNIGSWSKGEPRRSKGNLVGIGVVAVDKNGNPLSGDPDKYVGIEGVSFEPRAQIAVERNGRIEDFLESPEVISSSMSGASKKYYESSLKSAGAATNMYKEAHKKALGSKSTNNTQTKFKGVPEGGF